MLKGDFFANHLKKPITKEFFEELKRALQILRKYESQKVEVDCLVLMGNLYMREDSGLYRSKYYLYQAR